MTGALYIYSPDHDHMRITYLSHALVYYYLYYSEVTFSSYLCIGLHLLIVSGVMMSVAGWCSMMGES